MRYREAIIILIATILSLPIKAQSSDTAATGKDSAGKTLKKNQKEGHKKGKGGLFQKGPGWPSPEKAGIYSAILPGLGQAYNEKYWKIPVLYAGGAALGYAIHFNNKKYNKFRRAYRSRQDTISGNNMLTGKYTDANLRLLRNLYRRDRDFYIILSVVLYGCNIMDAIVDAHLMKFDISKDLSLNWQPGLYKTMHAGVNRRIPGVLVNINIK